MAIYPRAAWRDIHVSPGDRSNGRMHSYRGAVLHVNQSNGNLFNWVNNPANQVSCHFEVYKSGTIEQYIDTANSSWCQTNGNDDWLSIETEGFPSEPLTDAQLGAIAGLYAWMVDTHHIVLQLADTPSGTGFGWHGMGGTPWGGHPSCPGDLRKPQRQTIINMILGGDMEPADVWNYPIKNGPTSMSAQQRLLDCEIQIGQVQQTLKDGATVGLTRDQVKEIVLEALSEATPKLNG